MPKHNLHIVINQQMKKNQEITHTDGDGYPVFIIIYDNNISIPIFLSSFFILIFFNIMRSWSELNAVLQV